MVVDIFIVLYAMLLQFLQSIWLVKKKDFVLKLQSLANILFRTKRLSAKLADNCKQQHYEFLEDAQFKHKEIS